MQNYKELYINLKKETHLSFHLSTILKDDLYPWFYENFINIVIFNETQYIIDFVDNKVDESYRQFMEERIVNNYDDYINHDELIKMLVKRLDNEFYTYIWLDKFYIPDILDYQLNHFVHPVMIFGYNNDNNKFSCVDFDSVKGIVRHEINYEDFIKAFYNGKEYYLNGGSEVMLRETIISYKIKNNYCRLQFCVNRFLVELKNYIFSKPSKIKIRYQYVKRKNAVYGLRIYDKIIDVLTNLSDEKWIAFKSLHDFALHKKYMYDRLLYIEKNYNISEDCRLAIYKYKEIVDILEQTRLLNIKYTIIDGYSPASFSHNPKFIEKFVDILKIAKEKETAVLLNIYSSLRRRLSTKNNSIENSMIDDLNIEYFYDEQGLSKAKVSIKNPQVIQRIDIIDNDQIINCRPMGQIIFDDNTVNLIEDSVNINNEIRQIEFYPKKVSWFEYIECEKGYGNIKTLSFKIYKIPTQIIWDYSLIINDDWEATNQIKDMQINGKLLFTIKGRDPFLSYYGNIDADIAKYVYIKYKTTCKSEVAQLFFTTDKQSVLTEDKSKVITISPNDETIEYIFDMSDNNEWKGMVNLMRFDPVSYDNSSEEGECSIDHIETSYKMPEYSSKDSFCKTQGVNGWFYYSYNRGITYKELIWNGEKEYWYGNNNNDLIISAEVQTSCNHFASVRKWACPASGEYKVVYDFCQTSKGDKTDFMFKQNHKLIDLHVISSLVEKVVPFEHKLSLETGEALYFEFYNEDEKTIETITLNVNIIKIE